MITFEMIVLWTILAGAVILFSFDVFPADKVSLLVLGALVATGLVRGSEAISGFGDPATITVACMLALSYGVQRTGALNFAANRIIQFAGRSELKLLFSILATVGVLSAFINNTAAVVTCHVQIPASPRPCPATRRSPIPPVKKNPLNPSP